MQIYRESTTGKIPGLNALRFFGALSVVFLHLGSYYWFSDLGWEDTHRLVSGNTGVILFYVISGFLITSLALDEVKEKGNFDFLRFFQRRSLRLFPLYYLALLCIFILTLVGLADIPSTSWWYAVFYAYNMVPREFYNSLLGSFHTLATEEQFYIFYGGVLFLLGSQRFGQLIFKLPVTLSFLVFLIFFNNYFMSFFEQYSSTHFVDRWALAALDPLAIGCVAAFLIRSRFVAYVIERFFSDRKSAFLLYVALLISSIYLFLGYAYGHRSTELLSIGFCLFIVSLYFFRSSLVSKVLEWPPLVYLGSISYGIYVWQAVFNGTGSHARWIDSPYLSTALVFVVSVLSYELYEKRFLKLKRH